MQRSTSRSPFAALSFARGGGSDASTQTADMTAKLMSAPFGRVLVGAVGLAIIGVGAYHVYKGWKKKFLEDLQRLPSGTAGPVVRRLGTLGYVAKGVALAIVGVLFVTAAVKADPSKSTGLDGALHTLRDQPAVSCCWSSWLSGSSPMACTRSSAPDMAASKSPVCARIVRRRLLHRRPDSGIVPFVSDNGKPAARRGRKATGPTGPAELPNDRRSIMAVTTTDAPLSQGALLTPGEVAVLFRVDPKTVTRWAQAGKLSAVRTLGGHRRFHESEVRSLLTGVPTQRTAE